MATQEEQQHPANAVFMLLEDRQFRLSVVKPGLEKERQRLGRLVTGKHQVRGFRNISKAPASLLLPVIADEANVSAELAQALLGHWMEFNTALKDKVAAKLKDLGYDPKEEAFDEIGNTSWRMMKLEHANAQFEGEFLPDEDDNAVMLMSLLLGWFGSDEEEEVPEPEPEKAPEPAKPAPKKKETKAAKTDVRPKSAGTPAAEVPTAKKKGKAAPATQTKATPKKSAEKNAAGKDEKAAASSSGKKKAATSAAPKKDETATAKSKKKATPSKKESQAAKNKTTSRSTKKK